MPNRNTFDIGPIGDLVKWHIAHARVSIDPYARDKRWATFTNDLNPNTAAECHMDAVEFVESLASRGVEADLVILDPPYSPRQVKECYDSFGHKMSQDDALLGLVRKRLRAAVLRTLKAHGRVITCGWNSVGQGITDFELEEVLLICHGSDHNDTIVTVERRCEHREGPDLFSPQILDVSA